MELQTMMMDLAFNYNFKIIRCTGFNYQIYNVN